MRSVCAGNRRTPLTGESERVLEQRGYSTKAMPLSVNRLGSMGTSPTNEQLRDGLVCSCSFTVSTVFVVSCGSLSETVCRSGSFPFTRARGWAKILAILVTIQKAHVEGANCACSFVLELGTTANVIAFAQNESFTLPY